VDSALAPPPRDTVRTRPPPNPLLGR